NSVSAHIVRRCLGLKCELPHKHVLPPRAQSGRSEWVRNDRGAEVSSDNVIPFRKRPPSQTEMDVYRQMTRGWSAALRQRMFPGHFRRDQQGERRSRE